MTHNKFRQGWYVLYTKPNQEKKVHKELKNQVETFLPLKKEIKQWSDRKKAVEKPLFKSYVFVNLNTKQDYSLVLKNSGAVFFISINGKPALVTKKEIEVIKLFTGDFTGIETVSVEDIVGTKRRINHGPFLGHECYVLESKGKHKVIAQIDSLQSCIKAEFDSAFLSEAI